MPLIFAYGSLQQESVQLSTLGRRLDGRRDELLRHETALVTIDDPAVIAALGKTHHANVVRSERNDSRVPGMAFEITDAELISVDRYELPFGYRRIAARLASGREAWVYVHAPDHPRSDRRNGA